MFKPMVADIYHGDEVSDLKATASAGIKAIIHKATQGASIVDKAYDDRRKAARQHGLLWGAYHFANDENVEAQVENFLKIAAPDDNTLLALDFEPNRNNTMSLEQAREFMQLVFEKTGRRPVLYSGNLIKEELGRTIDPFFAQHRLWLCQYGPTAKLPPTWKKYWLWQYTGDGIGPLPHGIAGLRGEIDLNLYDGTPEQLAAEWVAGAQEAAPAPKPAEPQTSEAIPPPVVVTTPPVVVTRSATRGAPTRQGPVAPAKQPPAGDGFLIGALRVLAVLGFIICLLAAAGLGYWAASSRMLALAPAVAALIGLAAGVVIATLTFGSMYLLTDIAADTRRSRAILEREA